jgi:hypothetical protein
MRKIVFSRIWAMPNNQTFKIKPISELVQRWHFGVWADPFAGNNSPAIHSNDLNSETCAKFHSDALDWLKTLNTDSFDGAFYDPPYSMRQASECYKSFGMDKLSGRVTSMKYWSDIKDEVARIVKIGSHVICCGWNTMGLGKGRGFEMIEVLLVPHGGSRNDTIVTVEHKVVKTVQK